MSEYQHWLAHVCQAAREAGQVIMNIYQQHDPQVEHKSDGTPVTIADKQADQRVRRALSKMTPHIPVVSEENLESTPFSQRVNWSSFWLVDPLDGTKEFIERSGEFCVNIALIVDHKPVLGVVYGPVLDVMYCAVKGGQATKTQTLNGQTHTQTLTTHPPLQINGAHPVRVAVSRRHGRKAGEFINKLGSTEIINMGSALKSCLVAEGKADVYPRFGPTSHWDTAASQVIIEAVGGRILDTYGYDLSYQPTESLLNPHFIVVGDADFAWPAFPA